MNKIKVFTTFILMTIIFSFLNVQDVSALEKFEIDRLDVTIEVHEDGTYDIKEDYVINYTKPSLGIYRDIPTRYEMSFFDENGKEHKKVYKFPATDIQVIGEEFSVDSQFEGEQIIVGPESGPRYTGIREFSIVYKVHTQAISLDGQKEAFFQNLVSSWHTPVHEFHAKVSFDKDIDLSALVVKGMSGLGEFPVDCNIGDNEFTCDVYESVSFGQGNGITAQIPLPDDYFNRISKGGIFTFGLMAAGVLMVMSILFKVLYGKRPLVIEKISFQAPTGYNSPMVGYVYNDRASVDNMYSMLFEWANKGFIIITESEDESISFKKRKDIETEVAFERQLFNTMFYTDEEITTDDWQEKNVYQAFLALIGDVGAAVRRKGEIYNKLSQTLMTAVVTFSFIALALFTFTIINSSYMNFFQSVLTTGFLMVLQILSFSVFSYAFGRCIKNNKKGFIVFWALIYFVVSLVGTYFIIGFNTILEGLQINTTLYLLFVALINLALVFGISIKVRTQHGADIYGEVKGLRTFIKYAKEDELIAMQKENPHLYYDVLPYAQVFGMSDLWLRQFREIEIPQSPYYTTYRTSTFNNYLLMRSLTSSMNSIHSEIIPKVSSSSGGGSFSSGGGFSGGGFSGGGGFGGGGGGSR